MAAPSLIETLRPSEAGSAPSEALITTDLVTAPNALQMSLSGPKVGENYEGVQSAFQILSRSYTDLKCQTAFVITQLPETTHLDIENPNILVGAYIGAVVFGLPSFFFGFVSVQQQRAGCLNSLMVGTLSGLAGSVPGALIGGAVGYAISRIP